MNNKTVRVNLRQRSYDILIGSKIINDLANNLQKIGNFSKVFVISDENVAKNHLKTLSDNLQQANINHHNIILKAGEATKDFQNLQNLCEEILEHKIDRNSLLIAFGGGVIGDLCGFVASILLRGINFIQIPTTLLSMVDSSVGGKTAINSKFGKNLIGSFYQPKLVLCDLHFLYSLPKRQFASGYAEVVKYGLINDLDFFTYLEKNIEKIKDKQLEILQEIIFQSCQNKAKIVATDETEQGTRALLNLGHTFGHIFETETGYSDKLFHGEAVAIGMVMAAKMSEKLGLIDNKQIARIIKHLKQSNLPTSPQQIAQKWHIDNLLKHLYKDKKVKNNQLTFILMKGIGQSFIKENVSENLFLEVLDAVINN